LNIGSSASSKKVPAQNPTPVNSLSNCDVTRTLSRAISRCQAIFGQENQKSFTGKYRLVFFGFYAQERTFSADLGHFTVAVERLKNAAPLIPSLKFVAQIL